jgi:hypothetical protein
MQFSLMADHRLREQAAELRHVFRLGRDGLSFSSIGKGAGAGHKGYGTGTDKADPRTWRTPPSCLLLRDQGVENPVVGLVANRMNADLKTRLIRRHHQPLLLRIALEIQQLQDILDDALLADPAT